MSTEEVNKEAGEGMVSIAHALHIRVIDVYEIFRGTVEMYGTPEIMSQRLEDIVNTISTITQYKKPV